MRFNTFNAVSAPHIPIKMSGSATLNMTINGGFSLSSNGLALDVKHPKINSPRTGQSKKK